MVDQRTYYNGMKHKLLLVFSSALLVPAAVTLGQSETPSVAPAVPPPAPPPVIATSTATVEPPSVTPAATATVEAGVELPTPPPTPRLPVDAGIAPLPAPASSEEFRDRATPTARNNALKPALPEGDFTLEDAVFEEDANFNLDSAIRAYRKVIARFDNQRRDAALAVFRLGECYRKLGRVPQARTQYQRILKEFSDQHQLARLSQARLSAEGKPADNVAHPDAVLERLTKRRQTSLGVLAGANNVPHRDANDVQPSVEVPPHAPQTPPSALDDLDAPKSKPAEENGHSLESEDPNPAPAGGQPPHSPIPERNLLGISANVGNPPSQYQQSYTASRARAAAIRARGRADVLDRTIRLIENSPVESLPEPVSIDPRYRKLKDAYEGFLLEDTEEGNKKAAETLKKMEIWVNKIYLPELRSAQRAAMDQAIGVNSTLTMPAPAATLRP